MTVMLYSTPYSSQCFSALFFLTSGANFQKTQPPPNLSLLISPAGTCQQPGQHTACRKRRERINEGCFRRERFSPRINLSWKRSLYKAPFPLLKGHPALLQEAPCFFLNVLLWDTSLFLPQLYGFIQNKKKWWKKKKKKACQTCSSLWNQNRRFSACYEFADTYLDPGIQQQLPYTKAAEPGVQECCGHNIPSSLWRLASSWWAFPHMQLNPGSMQVQIYFERQIRIDLPTCLRSDNRCYINSKMLFLLLSLYN